MFNDKSFKKIFYCNIGDIFLQLEYKQHARQSSKMIIKGDKSNLTEECGVKLFEQGVRNKECQQTYINTANAR